MLRLVGFRVLEASDVADAEGWMREGERWLGPKDEGLSTSGGRASAVLTR